MNFTFPLMSLATTVLLVGCSASSDETTQSADKPLAALSLADLDPEALCAAAVPESQREPLHLTEVAPHQDEGVTSCYYLQVPGETNVNRGYAVSVYASLAELRGSVNIDAGGTLPRPVAVGDLPGAEQLDLGDGQWSAGITVAATEGRYVHMNSWAPQGVLSEDDLIRRAQEFSESVSANLTD
ncbi:exported hypothetical protein [Phycicoccus elongatus Lp2]|uniref:DUF3558 domain-containing protein n=1 Tax=Phycicoccus elongatus Lp2 TaxID=1193181 RepID=N0DYK1_9MICO|nr:hypothetical protein [Phycicoccus elongatus]CCH69467.1 exported hypothetical protein [Phycicoccus elongatus Lp2]